ncbi:MAG: hypothetical protein IPL19_18075 [Sandaracinaceae bacterium]|nr:hypothetical protein [Sandaracinaceae bacterium]
MVQQHPWALGLVVLGLALRLGVFPFHTWLVGLFENAPFGPLIMSVAPMPALIVVERVVTPSVAATLGEVPERMASLARLLLGARGRMVLVQTGLRRALGWFVEPAFVHLPGRARPEPPSGTWVGSRCGPPARSRSPASAWWCGGC